MAERVVPLRPDGRKRTGPRPPVRLEGVGLSRRGRVILDGVTASLGLSDITAILGPNGAGKTQLLRIIAGLDAPRSGRVDFAWPPTPDKHRVALVLQRPVLLRRSVRANLDHALRQYGISRKDRPARIAELLRFGELAGLAATPARALSGGEQQRLALVRALGAAPDLLLLDEPSAHLDPRSTAAIEGLIRRAADEGVRIILVTHDRSQARRLATDVLFLHEGRVAEHGPALRFFERPASREARAYLDGDLLL